MILFFHFFCRQIWAELTERGLLTWPYHMCDHLTSPRPRLSVTRGIPVTVTTPPCIHPVRLPTGSCEEGIQCSCPQKGCSAAQSIKQEQYHTTMKLSATVLLAALATATAYDVPSLTPDNYDEMTDGKAVFIKVGVWRRGRQATCDSHWCISNHSFTWLFLCTIQFFAPWVSRLCRSLIMISAKCALFSRMHF